MGGLIDFLTLLLQYNQKPKPNSRPFPRHLGRKLSSPRLTAEKT